MLGIYVVSAQEMKVALLRTIGVLIGLSGIGLLLGAHIISFDGGESLVTSSGYLLVVFVTALALLMASGGFVLALHGDTRRSLVPPWALAVAGFLMVLAIVGMLAFGFRAGKLPNAAGVIILGALGLGWLQSGIRGLSANKPLEIKRDGGH